jgi:hypothetical protein
MYVTCFDLYLDHPQLSQYKSILQEGIIKSNMGLTYLLHGAESFFRS